MKSKFLNICSIGALLCNECSFAMNAEENRHQLRRTESHRQLLVSQQESRNASDICNESLLNLNKISNQELIQYESFHNIKNLEMNVEYLYGNKTNLLLKLSAIPFPQLRSLKLVGNVGENKTILRNLNDLLSKTSQLKELFLSENKLKSFPHAIYKLKKLETLDLSKNPQIKKLPKSLWKFPNLQKVIINADLISSNQVPEYIDMLKNEEIITFLNSYKNKHKLSNSQIETTINNLHFCKVISVIGCHWNDETHSWIKVSSKNSAKVVKLKNMSIEKALIDYIKSKEHWNAVTKLMALSVDIKEENANSLDKYGIPILVKAAESGYLNVVKYLVEHGTNIYLRTKFKNTALMNASLFGYLDIVEYLVEQGANVNDQNVGGETALMRAAGQKHLNITKYLIQNGAHINMLDRFGNTALMKGAYHGSLSIVKYLIKHGANINAQNDSGNTVLMWAALAGQLNITKYLINSGVNINEQNKYGETALMRAIKEEQLKVVKCLAENGADVSITDNNGNTALYFAQERLKKSRNEDMQKYLELVELLENCQKTAPPLKKSL